MSLSLFKRERSKYYQVQGKVYFGNKFISIRESTRRDKKRDAEEVAKHIEQRAIQLLRGDSKPAISFSNAVITWTQVQTRSKRDLWVANNMLRSFRDTNIHDIQLNDWNLFTIKFMKNYKPASYNRVRDTFQSILKVSGLKVVAKDTPDCLTIPKRTVDNLKVIWLSVEQREMLFKSYPTWLRTWAIAVAYHGFRKGEARLLKRHDCLIDEELIRLPFANTKTSKNNFIPMHPRFKEALIKEGWRHEEYVFVNKFNKPYAEQGPAQAHKTAVIKANEKLRSQDKATIPHFTIHDWRHHFACTFLTTGGDMETLRQLGGWTNLKTLQRYVGISTQHKKQAMNMVR